MATRLEQISQVDWYGVKSTRNLSNQSDRMTHPAALTTDTIWAILHDTLDDDTANRLVWHGLGYRYNDANQTWDTSAVAAEWRDEYPDPPNFIASRPATVKLTRSIPQADKQLLKEELGFGGYTVSELVPRKTRRATMANWLLSYLKQQSQ